MSSTREFTEAVPAPTADGELGWKRLVWQAPAGISAVFVVLLLVFGPDPMLIVFTLVLAVLALVGWRFPRRVGPIAVLAAIGTLASWQTSARPAIAIGVAVIALGAVASQVANVAVGDASPDPGDLVVLTAGLRFVPPDITGSGEVTVHVDNTSPARHTFTIDALDLEVELPGGTAQRFQIDAPAGTYAFRCAVPGHEEMTGSLVVTG